MKYQIPSDLVAIDQNDVWKFKPLKADTIKEIEYNTSAMTEKDLGIIKLFFSLNNHKTNKIPNKEETNIKFVDLEEVPLYKKLL
ncbi:MAG: hypothetical protein Q7R78_02495 [bacterium]|nr:hypothetical protein [bacterium]